MTTEIEREWSRRVANNTRPTHEIFVALLLLGAAAVAGSAAMTSRSEGRPVVRWPRGERRGPMEPPPAPSPVARGQWRDRARRAASEPCGGNDPLPPCWLVSLHGALPRRIPETQTYTPIATSALTLLASFHGHKDVASRAHWARDIVYALAGLTGVIGTGFHLYNVGKRPGGFCWQNLFYERFARGAGGDLACGNDPVPGRAGAGQPSRRFARRARSACRANGRRADGRRSGRTAMEAGLLHFRGAFHNPAMLLPVTAPPRGRYAGRRGDGEGRTTAAHHALVVADDRPPGRRWGRLSCDRGGAQHGRLAELDREPSGGPPAARAAFLYRAGPGRPRGIAAPAGQSR